MTTEPTAGPDLAEVRRVMPLTFAALARLEIAVDRFIAARTGARPVDLAPTPRTSPQLTIEKDLP